MTTLSVSCVVLPPNRNPDVAPGMSHHDGPIPIRGPPAPGMEPGFRLHLHAREIDLSSPTDGTDAVYNPYHAHDTEFWHRGVCPRWRKPRRSGTSDPNLKSGEREARKRLEVARETRRFLLKGEARAAGKTPSPRRQLRRAASTHPPKPHNFARSRCATWRPRKGLRPPSAIPEGFTGYWDGFLVPDYEVL
jgi:hypothetical protein